MRINGIGNEAAFLKSRRNPLADLKVNALKSRETHPATDLLCYNPDTGQVLQRSVDKQIRPDRAN